MSDESTAFGLTLRRRHQTRWLLRARAGDGADDIPRCEHCDLLVMGFRCGSPVESLWSSVKVRAEETAGVVCGEEEVEEEDFRIRSTAAGFVGTYLQVAASLGCTPNSSNLLATSNLHAGSRGVVPHERLGPALEYLG